MNMIYSVLDSARYFFLAMGALMIVLGIDRADMAVYVLKYGLIYLCGFQLSRMCFHLFTAERLSIVEFGTYGVGLVAVLLLAKYRIDNANR